MNNVLHSLNAREPEFVNTTSTAPSLDSLSTDEFLKVVGIRVRSQRSSMSMSRKKLAEVSGVSERYLAQLESGQGNMSIALLRKVTAAINMSLATLLSAETPELFEAKTEHLIEDHQGSVRAVESVVGENDFNRDTAAETTSRWVAGQ